MPVTAGVVSGNTATTTAVKSGAAVGAFASTNAVKVCYLTDGNSPTCNADGTCNAGTDQATTAVPVMGTAAITYKVIGCANSAGGHTDSAVATFVYPLQAGDIAGTATSTVASGTTPSAFTSGGAVKVCYLTDGNDPTCNADGTCNAGTDQATTAVPAVTADITK